MTSAEEGIQFCNGELEIVRITEDLYDQAVELYQKYFMRYENVSIATNLLGSQQSIDEMEVLIRTILKDGVSFGARHLPSGALVAICVNKIIDRCGNSLDAVFETFRSPSMLCVGEYLSRMEDTFDLFAEWGVGCLLEIVFLSTRSDFGRRGIAGTLSQHTIAFARRMRDGQLSAGEERLPAHVRGARPEAVCSVFTSRFSQKVGEKLGFETVNKIANAEFSFEGKTFAEKIDPVHEFSTFAARRL